MPIDPSITLNVRPIQLANPLEQYMQVQQIQGAQSQNRLADLMYGEKQREIDQTLKLNDQYRDAMNPDGTLDRTKLFGGMASSDLGSRLPTVQKSFMDMDKAQAELEQARATTQKVKVETTGMQDDQREKKRQRAITDIAGFKSPQEALASLDAHEKAGDLTPDAAAAVRATIPTNPADFPKWQIGMLQRIMSAGDAMKYAAPDANTKANNATSRANNADNIKKDYAINGMNPDGSSTGDVETMAQGIAAGKLPPLSGFALARPRGQAIMARVMEINPTYDVGDFQAKNAALKGFSTGKEGTALRSFNVAVDHLDTLSKLADALHNRDTQAFNKAANFLSAQTGDSAPTNFDAVKAIVGKEVVKAIVAGGGGVAEREELAHLMDRANSPAQLKGVIGHFRELMDAQRKGLLDQYQRTTGRTDGDKVFAPSSPAAKPAAAAPALPNTNAKGWTLHIDANGNKAYVSPDGKSFEEVK